ncbi:MAG: nitroreductase family protein [Methanoregulaceae archaeon]
MKGILVDQDLCTKCGICSRVCPMGIVDPADEVRLPRLHDGAEPFCISCGHCEATCPSGALTLADGSDEPREHVAPKDSISSENLGRYLKSRRSIREYRAEPVTRGTIESILDIARYAASGGNGQQVEWLVLHDPAEVRKIAGLTIDWIRTLAGSSHPMAGYIPSLVSAWDSGLDPVCRNAPHLVVPHIPEGNPTGTIDAIIALTHFDIAAPAFEVGTCWAGFVAMAMRDYQPLQEFLALPRGRMPAYAMMFGYPRYKPVRIPHRKPLRVIWR